MLTFYSIFVLCCSYLYVLYYILVLCQYSVFALCIMTICVFYIRYDQEKRITARDALQHPYFRSLRTLPIQPGSTTTSVTTTARYTIVSHSNRDPGNSYNLRGTVT